MCGTAPFSPVDQNKRQEDLEYETKVNIKNVKYTFPIGFPSLASSFISQILVKDPKKRLTLIQMEEHPWLVSHFPDGFKYKDEEDDEHTLNLKSQEIKKASGYEGTNFTDPSFAKGVFTHDEIKRIVKPDSVRPLK